jgi:DNA-binding MarR family transcriptional regulator
VRFRARVYTAVFEAGFDDLQPTQVLAFRYPTIAGLRPGELGEQMGISKQAVNDLLRQLEVKGYIALAPDPADGRSRLIVLTERGSEVAAVTRAAAGQIAADWARAVGRRRFDIFRETLLQFASGGAEAGTHPAGLPPIERD